MRIRTIGWLAAIGFVLLVTACAGGGSPRVSYSVGVGMGGYGYSPWYGCRFGCGPPVVVVPPDIDIDPGLEATPLPSMDMDFGDAGFDVW